MRPLAAAACRGTVSDKAAAWEVRGRARVARKHGARPGICVNRMHNNHIEAPRAIRVHKHGTDPVAGGELRRRRRHICGRSGRNRGTLELLDSAVLRERQLARLHGLEQLIYVGAQRGQRLHFGASGSRSRCKQRILDLGQLCKNNGRHLIKKWRRYGHAMGCHLRGEPGRLSLELRCLVGHSQWAGGF